MAGNISYAPELAEIRSRRSIQNPVVVTDIDQYPGKTHSMPHKRISMHWPKRKAGKRKLICNLQYSSKDGANTLDTIANIVVSLISGAIAGFVVPWLFDILFNRK